MANDKPKHEKPNNAEKIALRNWLVARGVPQPQANQMAGVSNVNATRGEIANAHVTYCNGLPKAQKVAKLDAPQGVTPQSFAQRAVTQVKEVDWQYVLTRAALGGAIVVGIANVVELFLR